MKLTSLKTIAFVWCTLFVLWVVKSSSEASDNPNGPMDGHSQGTVEGLHPSKSDTENVPEGSSKGVSTHAIEPPLRRHLVQSSPVPSDEDNASCELTQSQRRRFYNRSMRVWNVTDVVLEELDNDVQSIVDCTASNDTILFSTSRTIQPRSTITITRNLTMRSQSDGPLLRNGSIAEAERKARFTCPSTGALLVIRTDSVLIANVVFEDCSGTANVVSINIACDERSIGASIHFLHVEFRSLSLSGNQHLMEAILPACAHLRMEHVIVRENLCGTNGCLSLSMNNTLINVEVDGNRAETSNDTMVSPSVFVLPSDSETFATHISASRNRMRLFSVVNSTFSIAHSYFGGNAISPTNQATRTAIGGGVLLSNHSTIDIRDSVFVNNSGWNRGGAIYAMTSDFSLYNCTFRQNDVGVGYGGAIYAIGGGSIVSTRCNFSRNNAIRGAGMYSRHTSSIQISNSSFFDNNGTSGAGLYIFNSTMTIRSCEFSQNNVSFAGGGVVGSSVDALILDSTLLGNNGGWGGAFAFDRYSIVRLNRVQFVENHSPNSGGAIYSTSSRMTLSNASFHRNSADGHGGAICLQQGIVYMMDVNMTDNLSDHDGTLFIRNSSIDVRRVLFHGNFVGRTGGGIYSSASDITITQSMFEFNSASDSGGAICVKDLSRLQIRTTIIRNNTSRHRGGALYAADSDVALRRTNFTNSTSSSGGGCYFSNINATLEHILLSRNWADDGSGGGIYLTVGRLYGDALVFRENYVGRWELVSSPSSGDFNFGWHRPNGGAISATRGIVVIHQSTFHYNNVTGGEGGALYFSSCNATIGDTNFSSNRATDYGGISARGSSRLNATNISLHSNMAEEEGGGIGIDGGSSLLCYRCNFTSNEATWGGGIAITSDDSLLIVAQIQDSMFSNNAASGFGGGVHFNRPDNLDISCGTPNNTCSRVALLNTAFVNNRAVLSGSAILTTEPEAVLVSCKPIAPLYDFLDQGGLNRLDIVHPKRLCESWTGNVLESNTMGDIVGTYGRGLSLSIDDDDEVRMTRHVESGFVLDNVVRGRPLPIIYVAVVDAFGNGPFITQPDLLIGTMSLAGRFFQGSIRTNVIAGSGSIPHFVPFQSPGNYTIKVSLRSTEFDLFAAYESERRIINWAPLDDCIDLLETNITVNVRDCRIGEEFTTNGERCQTCDRFSYNFNLSEPRGCTLCPYGSTCFGRFIVPEDGYWHNGPCYALVMQCIVEDACTYNNREEKLYDFGVNLTDCYIKDKALALYKEQLCGEGYEGPLCGSCSKGYGFLPRYSCSECPSRAESILSLVLLTLYLLILCSFSLRGALPCQSRELSGVDEQTSRTMTTWNSFRSLTLNIQMANMMNKGTVPSEEIRPLQTSNTPVSDSHQGNEPEMTRWKTSEILKILINFLQVTAAVAGIAVHWTSGIMSMFEAAEYVGALTVVAISRPMDCIVSSKSSTVRLFWRTLISLLAPGVVILFFVAYWGFDTVKRTKSRWYLVKRTILSVMIVLYVSYLGLTKLAVKAFFCVDVVSSEDPFSMSKSSYWEGDTAINCYGKEHIPLVVIGAIIITLISLSFPLFSAIIVHRYKHQREDLRSFVPETMGFLFRAFKEEYKYWESIVMLRKACLSVIVVSSYQLGGLVQTMLALLLLMLSLYVHITCRPYRDEFKTLNHYEAASLLVSCVTLTLGHCLDSDKSSDSAKIAMACVIVFSNIAMFLVLLVACIGSGINHMRAALEDEGIQIAEDARWWDVVKIVVVTKLSRCCGSSGSSSS